MTKAQLKQAKKVAKELRYFQKLIYPEGITPATKGYISISLIGEHIHMDWKNAIGEFCKDCSYFETEEHYEKYKKQNRK